MSHTVLPHVRTQVIASCVGTKSRDNTLEFTLNNSPHYPSCKGYVGKNTEETVHTKFLGLLKDNHLKWNNHTDQMIPKLCGSHYAFRLMFQVSNITQNVKGIYFIQK